MEIERWAKRKLDFLRRFLPFAGGIPSHDTLNDIIVHALPAAAGISAVIVASPKLFDTLHLAGAGYLAWLGLRSLGAAWQACCSSAVPPGGSSPSARFA